MAIDLIENENMNKVLIGDLLKEAREKKSLSIDAISRFTKINASSLEALEKNDVDRLPNIAYVKGFVKSYAKIVSLDQKDALALLDQLYNKDAYEEEAEETIIENIASTHDNATTNDEEPISKELKIKIDNKFIGIGVAALLSVILVFILINRGENETTSTKVVTVENKSKVITPQVLTAETPLRITIESPETKTDSIKDEVKAVEKEEVKIVKKEELKVIEKEEVKAIEKEEVKLVKKEGAKKEEIKFFSLPSPLFTYDTIDEEALNQIMPKSYQASMVEGKENIFIKAVDGDTWITYKADDDPIKKFVLKKDRHVFIRGNEVRVFLGNVNVAKVFQNNKLLKITAKRGVKSLVFPISFAEDLKIPLFIFKKDGSVITSQKYIEENPLN